MASMYTLEDPTARPVPLHSLLLFHPIFRHRRQLPALLLGPPLQLLFPIRPFLLPLQVLCLLGHLLLLLLGLALLLLRPDLGITGSASSTHPHFCSLPGFHRLHLLRQRLHSILSCLPHRNNLGTCMGSAYSSPASTPCPAWPSGPTRPLPFHQLMDALPSLHRRTQQHSNSLIRMYQFHSDKGAWPVAAAAVPPLRRHHGCSAHRGICRACGPRVSYSKHLGALTFSPGFTWANGFEMLLGRGNRRSCPRCAERDCPPRGGGWGHRRRRDGGMATLAAAATSLAPLLLMDWSPSICPRWRH